MARTTNPHAVAEKQDEILMAFQRLIYVKGYEAVSIRDILEATKTSKGALYYYFESKQAIFEALIERMLKQGETIVAPIAHQANTAATDKLSRIFIDSAKWKVDRGKEVFAVLAAWYAPGNDLIRYRMRTAAATRYRPYIESIVSEGVEQGLFTVADAATAAAILLTVATDLSDTLSRIMLDHTLTAEAKKIRMAQPIKEYTMAIERIVGAPTGSVALVDERTLHTCIAFAKELHADY